MDAYACTMARRVHTGLGMKHVGTAPYPLRCEQSITLRDGSGAQCRRYAHPRLGGLCVQHHRMGSTTLNEFGAPMTVRRSRSSRRGGVSVANYVLHVPERLVLPHGRALVTLCGRTTTQVNCTDVSDLSARHGGLDNEAVCRACRKAYRKVTFQ